jgi:membrane protein
VASREWHLSGSFLTEAAKRTWSEILADNVFGRAAELAYFFFLALFPLLICVVATLSVFGFADRGRALLFDYFGYALPPSAFELIDQVFTGIIQSNGPLKMSLGIIGSLWAASAGMTAVMDTLNAAYGVQETRSMLNRYAVALALTLGITILFVLAALIGVSGKSEIRSLLGAGRPEAAWTIVQWLVALASIFFALEITYYFAPNVRGRESTTITPGALLAVILWGASSVALRIYLHFFNSYGATYGSLGAVIALLLWLYLSGIAVLSGGALNGVLDDLE